MRSCAVVSLLLLRWQYTSFFWFFLFFFNDTATTEIYTLSLHDALPISVDAGFVRARHRRHRAVVERRFVHRQPGGDRSEEHTSELQSQSNLVCRLLLEKKKYTDTRLSINVDIPPFPTSYATGVSTIPHH